MALHSTLTHLDHQDSYIKVLLIDLSAAFNTVILSKLGIYTSLAKWTLGFLTNRPQSVKLTNMSSTNITLNTGVQHGFVLRPLPFLFTHDCISFHGCNIVIKFADNTSVVGRIRFVLLMSQSIGLRFRIWVRSVTIITFNLTRRKPKRCTFQCSSSFKFLGVQITVNLTSFLNPFHSS